MAIRARVQYLHVLANALTCSVLMLPGFSRHVYTEEGEGKGEAGLT